MSIKNPRPKIFRIVVKVGTALIDCPVEHFNSEVARNHAKQIAHLKTTGRQVILVSSGAVGAGLRLLGREKVPKPIRQRQALAALGQSRLMRSYANIYEPLGIHPAQVLLTRLGMNLRTGFINVEHCLETLLVWNTLPIVNENDTVAVEELRFGDNDQLAAMVAVNLRVNLLILLTNVEGLMDQQGNVLTQVDEITDEIEAMISSEKSALGKGGMATKLRAARSALAAGVITVIANGRRPNVITDIVEAACQYAHTNILPPSRPGTWFIPVAGKTLTGRKRWIAFSQPSDIGTITVDEGAFQSLVNDKKSLLASGVKSVEGVFNSGEIVQIRNPAGVPFAQGVVNYSHAELIGVLGLNTTQLSEQLPSRKNWEVIHRDDLVIF